MCCRANHVRLLIYPVHVNNSCLTILTLVKKHVVGWRYAGSGHGTRPCTATPTTHSLRSGTLPFRSSVDQIGANIACQQIAWVYRGPVVARTAPRAPSLAVALPSSVAAVPTPVLKGRRHVHVCTSSAARQPIGDGRSLAQPMEKTRSGRPETAGPSQLQPGQLRLAPTGKPAVWRYAHSSR